MESRGEREVIRQNGFSSDISFLELVQTSFFVDEFMERSVDAVTAFNNQPVHALLKCYYTYVKPRVHMNTLSKSLNSTGNVSARPAIRMIRN